MLGTGGHEALKRRRQAATVSALNSALCRRGNADREPARYVSTNPVSEVLVTLLPTPTRQPEGEFPGRLPATAVIP